MSVCKKKTAPPAPQNRFKTNLWQISTAFVLPIHLKTLQFIHKKDFWGKHKKDIQNGKLHQKTQIFINVLGKKVKIVFCLVHKIFNIYHFMDIKRTI